jgi:large subunit ribosomal protein L21
MCSTLRRVNTRSCPTQRRMLAYASVNHVEAYKHAIEGRHGQQLKLAYEEGDKYNKGIFDPFDEYKIEADGEHDEEAMEITAESVEDDDVTEEDFEQDAHPTKTIYPYKKDGSIHRTRAELVSLKAGAPAGGKFAIINLNGSQHKVTKDDVVILNKLRPVEKWAVGTTHTLTADDEQLLLIGSQDQTLVGLPYVNGGEVDVMVEEITRDKKVIIFKKKRRKNHRRKNGHKREVTFLRVLEIRFPEECVH